MRLLCFCVLSCLTLIVPLNAQYEFPHQMFPSKRPRTYRQYLTPGTDYVVPKSTEDYRAKGPLVRSGKNAAGNVTEANPGEAVGYTFHEPNTAGDEQREESRLPALGNVGTSGQSAATDSNETVYNDGELSEEETLSPGNVQESNHQPGSTDSRANYEDNTDETSEEETCSPGNVRKSSHQPGSTDSRGNYDDNTDETSEEETFSPVEDLPESEFERCGFLFEDDEGGDRTRAVPLQPGDEEAEPMQESGGEEVPQGCQSVGGAAGENEDGGETDVCEESGTRRNAYAEKYNLFEVIGAVDGKKSKFEVLLMIFHIVLRHGMTGSLIEDLLAFFNEICGESVLPASKYLFTKIFEPSMFITFQFFCANCNFYLGERQSFSEPTTACLNCKSVCNVKNLNGTNFYITLPIKEQMEDILQRPGIKVMSSRSESGGNICDFMDGSMFKKLVDLVVDFISITFNTDGAAVFLGKLYSLWPIWIMIDNLHPTQRFLGENLILCRLWFGKHSPDFSLYLTPFLKELQDLAKPGGGITLRQSNGETKKFRVFAPKACLDSVAKPKLLKMKQFNGTYGCGYCLHPGKAVDTQIKYPVRAEGSYPKRTAEGMRTDMFTAHSLAMAGELRKSATTDNHVNGVLGISPLLALPSFDIVSGFVIDYMHAILLGVTNKLLDLWKEMEKVCFVDGASFATVDGRVTKLKPPSNVQEPPKPLSKRSEFKAKEYRTVLLFYILPCFRGILKRPYYENAQMLVKAIFILLSERITPEGLREADTLLKNFVKTYNQLYGDKNMVYNVHLCSHLADSVKEWGPLWSTSAFGFESGNGDLIRLNKGTTGVASQISLKYCMVRNMREYVQTNRVSAEVLDFCSNVIAFKESKHSASFDSDIRSFTNEIIRSTNEEERSVLTEVGLIPSNELLTFNRVLKDGLMFYCTAYTKPTVYNDTCARLVDGTYGVIQKIFKISTTSTELSIFINIIRVAAVEHPAPHLKICSKDLFEPLTMRSMSDVKTKCLLLVVDGWTYVCDFPNTFEKH